MKYKRLLVTGAARSGTKYTAELLHQLSGLPVSHEEIYGLHTRLADGGFGPYARELDPHGDPPPWGDYRICVSWLAAPFLDRLPEDVLAVHQMRHPIRAIRSIYRRGFLQKGSPYGLYAVTALDGGQRLWEIGDEEPWVLWPGGLESACEYWVRWNDMIVNSRVRLWWRVEDLDSGHWILEPLLEHVVGADLNPTRIRDMHKVDVPTDINTGGYKQESEVPATLDDIPYSWRGQVYGLGRKFGYQL